MEFEQLASDLKRDEGVKLKPYRDSVGKLTIGVGHNLDDKPISEQAAFVILEDDIKDCEADLDKNASWWRDLPEPAQRGLLNMCFNLGWPRLSKFDRMLMALKFGRYQAAATEALDSKYAKQVGARADRIAGLFIEADK